MTELTWEGKYKDGKKVTPVRIALPFQTIETINKSNAEREKQQGLSFDQQTEWRNRLIWGDKKYVLPSLLPEFAGKVNLIYIDPPFNVGADFSFTAKIADDPDTEEDETTEFVKQPSIIEQKAYRDTWGKGLDSYMQWFYESSLLLKDLLADNASIYVHLDWHVAHYAKAVLDEVFGYDRFINEIVWRRTAAHNDPGRFGNIHDVLFFYKKSEDYVWNQPYVPHTQESIDASFSYAEAKNGKYIRLRKGEKPPDGYRRFQTVTLRSPHPRPNLRYEYKGYKPHANGWSCNRERMEQYDKAGKLFYPSSKDGALRLKMYLDESPGVPVQDLWVDIKKLEASSLERIDYVTQKPEAILNRLIATSSNEDDLILDCFCGSGTTAAVAEKLNRRWITCDLGRFAIHTTRKRLLGIENVKPFVVQNLGKYERQQWMTAEFESAEDRLKQERDYRNFIVELYHAQRLDGYTWLHGAKAGRMVHVGSVDAPVTVEDIKSTIKEFWKMAGGEEAATRNGIDFLGWDFAFEINDMAAHFASANNVHASFKKIPREVLEKKAVDQGDIRFYELASLTVDTKTTKSGIEVTLKDFIIPPDDVPEDVQDKITHWSQWIDYWAVDWDFTGGPTDSFHNQWQSYRTKKDPKLDLTARNSDIKPGKYTVLIKVIDILGNDTTKAVEVKV